LVRPVRPPSTPSLSVSKATQTTLTIAWRKSKGQRKVVAYRVYLDGSALGKTEALSTTISGLKCASAHKIQVEAIAARGIRSKKGAIRARTTDCAAPALYVATNGSDRTACTRTAPCASFNRAYQLATPGDVIQVAGGTYAAQTVLRSNPAKSAPATMFTPAPGSTVTVAGNLALGQNNGSLSGNTPSHLVFDGININGGNLRTYYNTAPQPTDISYLNAHIQFNQSGWHLLNLNSLDHFTARNVELGPECCNGDAVDVVIPRVGAPNPSNIVLDNLYIHDIYDSCTHEPAAISANCSGIGYGDPGCSVSCDHPDGIQAFGCDTCTIENSRIYAINPTSATSTGAAQGILLQRSNNGTYSDLTIANNMMECGCGTNLFSVAGGYGEAGFSGYIKLLYNTIDGGAPIYDSTGNHVLAAGTTITIVGNIIRGTLHDGNPGGSSACTFKRYDGTTLTPVYRNNLFANATMAACDPSNLPAGMATFVSRDFYSPDLRLAGPQAAINGGESAYCGPGKAVATDLVGTARPRGSACDVGAQEAR